MSVINNRGPIHIPRLNGSLISCSQLLLPSKVTKNRKKDIFSDSKFWNKKSFSTSVWLLTLSVHCYKRIISLLHNCCSKRLVERDDHFTSYWFCLLRNKIIFDNSFLQLFLILIFLDSFFFINCQCSIFDGNY